MTWGVPSRMLSVVATESYKAERQTQLGLDSTASRARPGLPNARKADLL